jgi:KDO2-lipid IV(A) lauroyltransferase
MRGRAVLLLLRLLSLLPLRLNHALGGAVGWLVARAAGGLRRVAAINLELALPDMPPEQREQLLGRILVESGKSLTEMGVMWHWPADRILSLVREVEGVEAVDRSLASGRGVVMLTPHLGCWEIAGLFCASRWPMTILYRPPRLAELESLTRRGRSASGAELARTDLAGVRRLLARLRDGGMVGILPDQEPGAGNGIFAPWFGEPAYTMVLVNRLLKRSGADLFIACSERLPAGKGYRIGLLPVAPLLTDAMVGDDQLAAVTALNRAVESVVLTLPEQYQWAYRRYRTRPPGAAKIY